MTPTRTRAATAALAATLSLTTAASFADAPIRSRFAAGGTTL